MSAQGIPLKSDFRERARVNDIRVARLIGFEAKEIADARHGHVGSLTTARKSHGNAARGILCDIADAAMGMAFASTLAPDETFTTVELRINFFRPIWQAQLKAEGSVVQQGRSIGYVECDITDKEIRAVAIAGDLHGTSRPQVCRKVDPVGVTSAPVRDQASTTFEFLPEPKNAVPTKLFRS